MRNFILAAGVAIAVIGYHSANAGTASRQAAITLSAPLVVTFAGVAADCTWAPGRVIMTLATTGGDGKPVTYTFGAPVPTDLAISGNKLVIGPTGIAPTNCGTVENVTINATQP